MQSTELRSKQRAWRKNRHPETRTRRVPENVFSQRENSFLALKRDLEAHIQFENQRFLTLKYEFEARSPFETRRFLRLECKFKRIYYLKIDDF